MVVVAEGAAWVLAPDDPASEPETVSEEDYFEPEAIERARDYRGGQRALMFAGLAAQGVILVALATGRPRFARTALERLGERPVLGAVAAGAGLSLTITLVGLPFDVAAHERSVDAGLSTQSLDAWLGDFAKGTAISVVMAGAGAALLLALVRRFPRGWWAPAAAGGGRDLSGLLVAGPVVLAPLFNKFDALPEDSRLRAEVLELGREGGVDIGEVYRVDASPPIDRAERLCRRVGADEARRPLRQPDRLRRALRAALGGGARAWSRREQRHPARDPLHRDRRHRLASCSSARRPGR